MDNTDKIRISLDLPHLLNDKLEAIAARDHLSKSEVLRKALALMVVASDAAHKGKKIGIATNGQALETEFVNL
jgi:metal-responsive CopG/Arc/MetJ family transcriptional regulator